jgi:MFS family permease
VGAGSVLVVSRRAGLRRLAGGLPRPFWVVVAGTFINRIGFVVEPFLALYLAGERDLDASTIGAVIACFGFGSFASQPIGGYFADRVGRRSTLVASMIATAASFMLLASARGIWLIAIASLLAGLAIDSYRPAVSAMVADLVKPEQRARAYAMLYWAINLGVAIAGVAGGFLASRSYWLLFVLDAVTCLAFAALIARFVPETRVSSRHDGPSGYGPVLRDRLLLGLAFSIFLGSVVYLQQLITLPLAVRADGHGAEGYGLIYAVNPITVIAVQPLVLWVIDRLPPIPLLSGSSIVMGAGFALTAVADTLPIYALTVVVWTLGEIGFNAVGPALIADIAPAHLRGRYSGIIGVAFGSAAFVAPLLGTWVYDHVSPTALWIGCLALSGFSALIVLMLAGAIRERRAAIPADGVTV